MNAVELVAVDPSGLCKARELILEERRVRRGLSGARRISYGVVRLGERLARGR